MVLSHLNFADIIFLQRVTPFKSNRQVKHIEDSVNDTQFPKLIAFAIL